LGAGGFNFEYLHPRGPIRAVITAAGLRVLQLPTSPRRVRVMPCDYPELAFALEQALSRYFAGKPEHFQSIPLDLNPGTAFQMRVWQATRAIGWGEVSTYGAIAARIACGAPRAVGQALGHNPAPLVVPCHRVLAAGGKLGGFSCGLDWKRELLRIEGVRV